MRGEKHAFRGLTLSTRLAATMVLLVVVSAGVIAILNSHTVRGIAVADAHQQLRSETQRLAAGLTSYVGDTVAAVLAARGEAALAGIARARRAGGRDPETGLDEAAWRHQLADRFEADLHATPRYLQFRYLGPDGREIVRVDRSGPSGAIRTVPEQELQDKGSRDYFKAGLGTPPGQVYLSPIDLNQEHDRIEVPHVPVLRAATAVTDDDGKVAGVLVINVDMARALDRLRESAEPGREVFVVNDSGDYLVHPDRAREFGFDLGHRARIQGDFPALTNTIPASGTIDTVLDDTAGGDMIAAVTSFHLARGPRVSVVEMLPLDAALEPAVAINRSSLIAGGGVALIAIVVALAVGHGLTAPLRQITNSVSNVSAGRPPELPVNATAEVGVLAQTLKQYIDRERFYTSAIESTDDAVLTKTLDGTITSWNRGAERLYGYSASEAIGRSINLITPEERRPETDDILGRIAAGESVQHFVTQRITKTGHRLDVSLTVSPVRDPSSGNIAGASAIARDITEQRRIQAQFRMVIEACPVGVILTDEQGAIQLVNSAMERMFGYRREEIFGQPVEILVPTDARTEHPRFRQQYALAPESRLMGEGRDLQGRRKDGSTFPVEISLSPTVGREGVMVICVVADITRRKAAERALLEQKQELERSNTDLEQFAYVASHDLREPLRMVASYTELLAERYRGQLDERADRYIGYAAEGAKRMQEMVGDLLAYSRAGRTALSPKPVDTNVVVRKILGLHRLSIIESGAEVEYGELPTIVIDEGQFAQMVQNLIGNALKFRGDAPPRVEISAERQNGSWVFAVKDNGIGIDEQHAERIFQMFQRLNTRDKYEGSGIGLAIVKKIAERHGGRIWFRSKPGEGTTFFLSLPVELSGDPS